MLTDRLWFIICQILTNTNCLLTQIDQQKNVKFKRFRHIVVLADLTLRRALQLWHCYTGRAFGAAPDCETTPGGKCSRNKWHQGLLDPQTCSEKGR